jgi:hypothetical protein
LVVHGDDAARIVEHDCAPVGQLPHRTAREQLAPQDATQSRDLCADRGLAEIERLACLGVTAGVDDGHKRPQDFNRDVLAFVAPLHQQPPLQEARGSPHFLRQRR